MPYYRQNLLIALMMTFYITCNTSNITMQLSVFKFLYISNESSNDDCHHKMVQTLLVPCGTYLQEALFLATHPNRSTTSCPGWVTLPFNFWWLVRCVWSWPMPVLGNCMCILQRWGALNVNLFICVSISSTSVTKTVLDDTNTAID